MPSSKVYRLGCYLLPEDEIILIKAFLRLFVSDQRTEWLVVQEGPFDALVVDASALSADSVHKDYLRTVNCPVLGLVRGVDGLQMPDQIARPVKPSRLRDWLSKVAVDALVVVTPKVEEKKVSIEPVVAKPVRHEPLVLPAADGDVSAARYKLVKWPSAEILRNDRASIRIASLLSRQALQVDEIAGIAGVTESECQAFISDLMDAGFVDSRLDPLTTASVLRENAATTRIADGQTGMFERQHRVKKSRFANALVGSIRKRLGL